MPQLRAKADLPVGFPYRFNSSVVYPFMVKKFQHLKHTGANEHLRKWKAYDVDWLRFCRKIIFLHEFEINYIDVSMLRTTVSHIHVLFSTSPQYRSDWAVYIRIQNTRLGVSVKKPNVEYFSIGTWSFLGCHNISIYRNTRRIYSVSQYEIRIAIYRNFAFF